jgi:hypothetical protein
MTNTDKQQNNTTLFYSAVFFLGVKADPGPPKEGDGVRTEPARPILPLALPLLPTKPTCAEERVGEVKELD